MTNIGFVGLGKLGYPIAAMMAMAGHKVIGTDVNTHALSHDTKPYKEAGLRSGHSFREIQDMARPNMMFTQKMNFLVARSNVIFVAVQTPHQPEFDGTQPLTDERADFDYEHLINACAEIASAVHAQPSVPRQDKPTIAIISTVLPGTIDREIIPIFEGTGCPVIHMPEFLAMGTALQDFCSQKTIVVGGDKMACATVAAIHIQVQHSYAELLADRTDWQAAHIHHMSIRSAELTKLACNTFASTKIAFANTIGELSHKVEADCDDVMSAVKAIASPTGYLNPGMGDGGGCHPRDNIAMSWLASEAHLSHNLFNDIMVQREFHARWLATRWLEAAVDASMIVNAHLPLVMAGTEFKPETKLEDGSPALLVLSFMRELGYDAYTLRGKPDAMAAYFIGCKHDAYRTTHWPKGSVVIDPFRYIPDQSGVKVIRIGEHRD